jgi:hypothetical protein
MFPYAPEHEARIQRMLDNEIERINTHRDRNVLLHRIHGLYPDAPHHLMLTRVVQYLEFLWGNFPVHGQIVPPTVKDVYYRNYTGFPTLGAIHDEGGSIHIHVHHL